jgi:putative polyhydroxyalkanoic acid system protein
MSKPIVVIIEHQSTKVEVKDKLRNSTGQIRSQLAPFVSSIEERWNGDVLEFRMAAGGQAVTGSIDVDDTQVRVELILPGLLGVLAQIIASRIQQQGMLLLEKEP